MLKIMNISNIDEDACGQIHNCYYYFYDKIPTDETILNVFNKLPQHIHLLAEEWGWWDTEVREETYLFIKNMDEN